MHVTAHIIGNRVCIWLGQGGAVREAGPGQEAPAFVGVEVVPLELARSLGSSPRAV